MLDLKARVSAAAIVVALGCAPITPALADGYGHHGHGWGIGRGVVGAAVALATLPLLIASEVLAGGPPPEPYGYAPEYAGPPPDYYSRPEYAARPPAYYRPPMAYYGGPEGHYRPSAYYAHPRLGPYGPARGYDESRPRYFGSYGDRSATRPDDRRYRR
jgi:hypothetical protein